MMTIEEFNALASAINAEKISVKDVNGNYCDAMTCGVLQDWNTIKAFCDLHGLTPIDAYNADYENEESEYVMQGVASCLINVTYDSMGKGWREIESASGLVDFMREAVNDYEFDFNPKAMADFIGEAANLIPAVAGLKPGERLICTDEATCEFVVRDNMTELTMGVDRRAILLMVPRK